MPRKQPKKPQRPKQERKFRAGYTSILERVQDLAQARKIHNQNVLNTMYEMSRLQEQIRRLSQLKSKKAQNRIKQLKQRFWLQDIHRTQQLQHLAETDFMLADIYRSAEAGEAKSEILKILTKRINISGKAAAVFQRRLKRLTSKPILSNLRRITTELTALANIADQATGQDRERIELRIETLKMAADEMLRRLDE